MSQVRVLIRHRTDDCDGVQDAYQAVSEEMAVVPGMLGNELLRGVHDPQVFVVASRWRDLAAFQEWEAGASHQDSTSPMRQYRDHSTGRPFEIFQVAAEY
jgi:heme-degrading monooxygenase HmoA